MTDTLVVIPARLGATRLPRKPLRLLAGIPLVVRVWERVRDMHLADRCVVATDAPEIADAVRQAGGDAVMTRADHPSGTDRVAEVARSPGFERYDLIVNVQGDEPFVAESAVRGAIDAADRHPLGTAAIRADAAILDRPDVVKVVRADDGRALYFSRAPIPFLRDVADESERRANVLQHVGVYAYRRDALARWVSLPTHPLERIERLEQLRPLAAGLAMGVSVVDAVPTVGIDTEEDLARANEEWTTLSSGRS